MKPIPSLIPRFNLDYNFSDFRYGIKSTFSKNAFGLGKLETIFGKRSLFFTNTGRSSLYIILRALSLPPRSKIGVPLYSCTVVFDAIIKAGHVPCFIDIDDNYTMDPSDLKDKIEDLSAVVVIHTFGRPADMDKIKKIAKEIPVIEDCAHSLLSEYKGRITGTLGTVSFFSFKKYTSTGEGGMAILNEGIPTEDFQREINLLNDPSCINEIKHSFKTYIHSFLYHKPWYGTFAFPIGSYLMGSTISTNKKYFEATKIRKSDLSIFFKKLELLGEKVERQRKNSEILIKELENTSLILPYENNDTFCNYYLFPILFNSKKERDRAHEYLREMGVDTAKLYYRTLRIARQIYGYKDDCHNAEKCAETLLTVPNYYSLTDREVLEVAEGIKKVEGLL